MAETRLLLAKLAYQGTAYLGWQVQNNGPSVQAELHRAISQLFQIDTKTYAPSRTDSGVHARGQIFTFTAPSHFKIYHIQNSINSLTPDDMAVIDLVEVPHDFYPRKKAQGKRYSYVIHNGQAPPILARELVWWVKKKLNYDLMQAAIPDFVGTHDFSAFRGKDCTADSPVKFIKSASMTVTQVGKITRIDFDFVGSGFVRFMIRHMVGMLVLIGQGKLEVSEVKKALATGDCHEKLKAKALGLTLEEVFLDPDPFVVSLV